MKVALVHDDLVQFGGAERVLLALHEIWPDAPVYTSFASKAWRNMSQSVGITLKTSFMQHLPLISKFYRHYSLPFFYNLAFEKFDFKDFDLVISSSSRFAHSVITRPEVKHVCYMHTPGRMFWEPLNYFEEEGLTKGKLKRLFATPVFILLGYMRLLNYLASKRVDFFVANSQLVRQRVQKNYHKDAVVISPFCDVSYFSEFKENPYKSDYFLILSRLVTWKKIDLAVKAFTSMNLKLIIAGEGPDKKRLESIAGPNVQFMGYVSEDEKRKLLNGCRALIFPQVEDFGITALEAHACGKPVLAYRDGGATEIIVEGKTGEFFTPHTPDALVDCVRKFDPSRYNSVDCVARAIQFDKDVFVSSIKDYINKVYVS